jgi:hypothetical protein
MTVGSSTTRIVFLILCLATLSACPRGNLVVLARRQPSGELLFVVADEHEKPFDDVDVVDVLPCGDVLSGPRSGLWQIRLAEKAANASSVARQSSFVYGATPRGWLAVEGPLPLRPGCYEVEVHGRTGEMGGTRFNIDSLASVPGSLNSR